MYPEGKGILRAQTFSNMIESFLFEVLTLALIHFISIGTKTQLYLIFWIAYLQNGKTKKKEKKDLWKTNTLKVQCWPN